ncbi:right-handed parallel beta-helix repeat-containing protein [Mucilaginibacter sp. SMC90]|uniref:right-handed parallel beta-helix repeat-containing protein n=1 Tax=Mucilaginibacter sp. SMC90 TaxID=2929803 RepID=UPI001FB2B583|nr:right-handed parallel beta-helix repeat-containing protein [Mucilaginibacter sp. SMC90]UOE46302.1 right-handed parallel beta-helix repeat-containing protein [Mucilaginibacter sp. SMC90]
MRNFTTKYLLLLALLMICSLLKAQNKPVEYSTLVARHISPGNRTYYIDPVKGNDSNNGKIPAKAWKTFMGINRLVLSAGDNVTVLSPGGFHETMAVVAHGTKENPVTIKFAPGKYDFFPDGAFKTQLHISNTNDVPYGLKAIALMLDSSRFVNVTGGAALVNLRGKMIETYINHSNNVKISGLSFDYQRPTVSEFTITELTANHADAVINNDSEFSIKDSTLTWIGEGWRYQPDSYWQQYNPATRILERLDIPQQHLKYASLNANKVRIFFRQNPGFHKGMVYQNRDVTRDCAGIFIQKSSNIDLNQIRIYFMHGMGVVSQFSKNLSFTNISVKARTGRTCAAWADILHFSGCNGKIEVAGSYLSGANDDAINVHGTFLKITEKLSPTQVKVRFMHDQTYGFDAFSTGDSIGLVHPASLLSYQNNKLLNVKKLNNKEFLLNLNKPLPDGMETGDVVENITATPEVWIHHNTIEKIPTRGILVTTRRKVLIENNIVNRTHNSAIMINDDASSWYESGAVKNVTIQNNTFYECGGPVIGLLPENKVASASPVHTGIKIAGNKVTLKDARFFEASSTGGVRITGNKITSSGFKDINKLISLKDCKDVKIYNNQVAK